MLTPIVRSPVSEDELLAAVGQGGLEQVLADVSVLGWEKPEVQITTGSLLDYLEGCQDDAVYTIASRLA